MASVFLLFLTVMVSFTGYTTSEKLVYLKCQSAVSVIGQNTMISCSLTSTVNTAQIIITSAIVTKVGEEDPLFKLNRNSVTGDPRFKLPSVNDPSLMISNTALSDEGEYEYQVMTSHGYDNGKFRISVTAQYNKPVMSSRPEQIVDGGGAELFCEASGGYPAGTIHWFDRINTNWTKNSELKITQREDKLFHLTSKLTFSSIDSSWAPFRCVVLNHKYKVEAEAEWSKFELHVEDRVSPQAEISKTLVTKIVAPVVVIGSLIIGLLTALLLRGRCSQRRHRIPAQDPEIGEEKMLNGEA